MALRRSKRKAAQTKKGLPKRSRGVARDATKLPKPKPSTQEPDDVQSADYVWLDALPHDVCCRIAAYITRDRNAFQPQFQNEDALELALTSPKQRNVMFEALDHTPDLRYGSIWEWIEVFEHPTNFDARGGCERTAVLELLSRSSLRSAKITNRGSYFKAIVAGNSVTDLSIYIERLTDARYTSMLSALKKMTQLVSLAILCDSISTCTFESIIDGLHAYQRLADACPRLSALHMRCQCETEVDHSPVVDAFPSLKEITVTKPLPDAALPYMRSRESVVLQAYGNPLCYRKPLCRYASKIGAAVTGMRFPKPNWTSCDPEEETVWMTEVNVEEVAMLKDCSRLRELELLLCPGAEQALPDTNLFTSLKLHWKFKSGAFEEKAWLGKPLDASFVRRMFAQPFLHQLTLVGACILIDDLETVLLAVGKSLEKLAVSGTGQPEGILDRILGILDKVHLHNDNVRNIRIIEPSWIDVLDAEEFMSDEPVMKRKEFPHRFRERVRKLQRKNPWFDCTVLFRSVSWLISHCEVHSAKHV